MKFKNVLDDLARISINLSGITDFFTLIQKITEQAHDITGSDGTGFYLVKPEGSIIEQVFKRGRLILPSKIALDNEIIDFIIECEEAAVLNSRKESLLSEILLNPKSQSGAAIVLKTPEAAIGILFFNSYKKNMYTGEIINFIESFCKMAGGLLHNSNMIKELKLYFEKITKMEQYQKNIFSSMSNLLLTTDRENRLVYFNDAAAEGFSLVEADHGKKIESIFEGKVDSAFFDDLKEIKRKRSIIPGIEGIYKSEDKEMDFGLSMSPLKGKNQRFEGITLIFTDQSKERELKQQMHVAVEERRVIKDMFSRYMSKDLMQSLMKKPDSVKLGGAKRNATVFFADIRGYTSFSEGKDPEYIIEVLNEYFSEAVEIVIKYNGYIDKFIGDCIMAAWGVPMTSEKEDAVLAVQCASEIQKLVKSDNRNFFKGEASHLSIGIGMHTGPLVAGNLGSNRRMDYSMIGDTVNVAARLEGVAGPGEIIITESTMKHLGGDFNLEKRESVKVKGKAKPLGIYNVLT